MDFFHKIDDANAIVRLPKGVYKQVAVYRRGKRIFVPHAGGFVRVVAKFGDVWLTSHPDIKVEEIDASFVVSRDGSPEYRL